MCWMVLYQEEERRSLDASSSRLRREVSAFSRDERRVGWKESLWLRCDLPYSTQAQHTHEGRLK